MNLEAKLREIVPKPTDKLEVQIYEFHIIQALVNYNSAVFQRLKEVQRLMIMVDYMAGRGHETIYDDTRTQAPGTPERENQRTGLDDFY